MVRADSVKRLTSVRKSDGSKGSAKPSIADGSYGVRGDKLVEVSNAPVLSKMTYRIMADMPVVWMERIEEIRDALASGRFSYDSKEVATRIVKNALAEHPWK